MTALTIFVLFADDVRLAYFASYSDNLFFTAFFVSFILFLFEVILYCAVEKGYFLPYPSFYFWLDTLAAFSIWLDVPWLWNPIDALEAQNMRSDALMAGKASRVGTRAAKIVRIIRLLRMVRIAKFLSYEQRSSVLHRAVISDVGRKNEREKADTTHGNKGQLEEDSSILRSPSSTDRKIFEGANHPADSEPSIVSQKLTKLTNSRVILITLVCIFLFPFFDVEFNSSLRHQGEIYGLVELHRLPQDRNISGSVTGGLFKTRVEQYIRDVGNILYIDVCPKNCANQWNSSITNRWLRGLKFQEKEDPKMPYQSSINTQTGWNPSNRKASNAEEILKEFRKGVEVAIIAVTGCYNEDGTVLPANTDDLSDTCYSIVYIDTKKESIAGAINNSMKTLFVMFLLLGSSLIFVYDAELLVVEPLERMYNLVRRLADNPLDSLNNFAVGYNYSAPDEFETVILEKAFTKIGSLLQVGFGHAGASIIAKNMGRGELKTLEPGKKVTCVFVYAQIDNYTKIMSSLKESAIQYINMVASIVHKSVHTYYGAANKNTGSSFLLAWRIGNGETLEQIDDGSRGTLTRLLPCKPRILKGGGKRSRKLSSLELIESSLAAILQIRVHLKLANKNGQFAQFVHNPALVASLGGACDATVRFGIHLGWAIEGAVGSKHKIDASYLSPNVNLAARLAGAAKQYGSDLLLSGSFVGVLSDAARKMCRKIDCVTVKGSTIPVDLYVFDLQGMSSINFLEAKYDARGRQEAINFSTNIDLIKIRSKTSLVTVQMFQEGLEYYLEGVWEKALKCFRKVLVEKPTDGPSMALLKVIEAADGKAPKGWNGCRQLSNK